MAKAPCFTIITPVYNQGDYIAETIESVLAQTFTDYEYIVINDGSTDNTQQVLDSYQDKITIITQENMGQSATLNKGWQMAKGRYLGYLSADDIIYPHCLSEIAAHISDTPKILYPDYDLISADTSFIRQIKTAPTTTKKLIEELECTPGLAAFFPASLFKQTGGWRTDLVYIPDYEFWLRLFRAGAHFTRVPQSLGGFRIHAGSGSVRAISYERSEEIIALAQEYGQLAETRHGYRIARQNAYLIAARSHFQSARYLTGLARWFEACRIGPLRNILRPSKLRFILAGLLRRFVIGLKE